MKTLFIFLLSTCSLVAQLNISNPFYVAGVLKPTAAGGGNAVDASRGFEVDSDPSGWSETDTGSQVARFSTSQANSGTHSLELLNTVVTVGYQTYDIGSAKSGLSMCTWVRTPSTGTDDICAIINLSTTGDPNDPCVRIFYQNDAGSRYFRLRGTTFPAGATSLSAATWYRLELVMVGSSTSTLKIFDTGGSQVGSDITVTADAANARYVLLGRSTATAGATFSAMYYDDWGIDWTDSTSPLWSFTVAN